MKLLVELPTEILAEILFGCSRSCLVITLWKCGDKRLNKKLASAITFLDLEDTRLASTSRYPKLISELTNLRYLSINRGSHPLMNSSRALNKEIMKIQGSKIETLKFSSYEASSAFRRHSDADDEYGDPIFLETGYELGPSPLYMSQIFPRLTTLEIAYKPWDDNYYPSGSAIEAYDLPGLPPTLTRLSVPYLYLHELWESALDWQLAKGPLKMDTSSLVRLASTPTGTKPYLAFFAALPRSLQVLDTKLLIEAGSLRRSDRAHKLEFDGSFFANAPPNLHTIAEVDCSLPIEYGSLPRSLVHCDFGLGQALVHTPASFAQHPPSLASMKVYQSDSLANFSSDALRWATVWPPKLSKLSVNTMVSADLLRSLPPTLTHFENYTFHYPAWSEIHDDLERMRAKFWPHQLSTLILEAAIPEYVIASLPLSLTKLQAGWNREVPFPSMKLPRGLLDLQLHVKRDYGLEYVELFVVEPDLPHGLISLSLNGAALPELDCDSLALPSSLTALFIDHHLEDSSETDLRSACTRIILPQGLKSLHIEAWDSSVPFPPSLTNLSVSRLYADTDSKGFCTDVSALMPPSLEELVIRKILTNAIKAPADCFKRLVNLRRLNVSQYGLFDASILANLSKKLKSVSLSISNFTKDHLPYINQYWLYTGLYLQSEDAMRLLSKVWPPESRADDHSGNEEIADIADRRFNAAQRHSFCYPDPRIIQATPANTKKATNGKKK